MNPRKTTMTLWGVLALEAVAIVVLCQRPASPPAEPFAPAPTPAPSVRVLTPEQDAERILEDDPRFDCETMGNMRCGKPR